MSKKDSTPKKPSAKGKSMKQTAAEAVRNEVVIPSRFPTAHKAADPTLCATAIAEYLKWNKGVGEYDAVDEDGNYKSNPCPLSPEAWSATLNDAVVLLNDYSENAEKLKKANALAETHKTAIAQAEKKLNLTVEQIMAAVTIIKALLTIINAAAKLLPENSKFRKAIQTAKDFISMFNSADAAKTAKGNGICR